MRARMFDAVTLVSGVGVGTCSAARRAAQLLGRPRFGDRNDHRSPASAAWRERRGPHADDVGGRGSSSGSATLAEALRLGKGPAAILMLERDAIVVVGAMVAAELYGLACPVALANGRDWETLAGRGRPHARG